MHQNFFHVNIRISFRHIFLISKHDMFTIIWVCYRIKFTKLVYVLIKVHSIYRWSIVLKLVTAHHWSIFYLAVLFVWNLTWRIHSDVLIYTVYVKLLRFIVLIFKMWLLCSVKSWLKHDILIASFLGSFWSIRIFLRISPWSQVTYGFESQVLLMSADILILIIAWVLGTFFQHCGWLCMGVANLFLDFLVVVNSIVT